MPDICKKTDLVVKDNAVIEASYRLTLTEQRLVLAAIVEARESDNLVKGEAAEITARHFVNLFPDVPIDNAYHQIKEACDSLMRRQVAFTIFDERTKKPGVRKYQWVRVAEYIPGAALIRIRFSDEVTPLLSRLEGNLTRYRLELIAPMTSQYAIRLYELLVQYKNSNNKAREFSIPQLKAMLGIDETEYTVIKDFKKRVIDVAVTQINTHTDIRLVYENIKAGRSVVGLLFSISEKTATPEPTKKKAAKPPKITREYIEKNNLARAGESWDETFRRLAEERGQQRLVD